MADPLPRGLGANFERLYRRLEEAERALSQEGGVDPEERQRILAERAQALAFARARVEVEALEVLAFRVGGERYAVPIEEVDEVLEIRGLSPLLGAPRHVLGAVVARARVLPVFDLRALLGLEGGGLTDLNKVVAVGRGDDLFGIAVEDVEGRLALPLASSQRQAAGPFAFVTADRLAVLDLAQLGEPGALPRIAP
jgi:purine-binding chemotaxis protein CheW